MREGLFAGMAFLLCLAACSNSGSRGAVEGSGGAAGAAGAPADAVLFMDDVSGFETPWVHDVDRQRVTFDAASESMVGANGTAVSGWTTDENDLNWERSSVAFRVRFGTENGERRAYFTETDTGTICDLDIYAEDQLRIYSTREVPPAK